MSVGQRLASARAARGLTVADVAAATNLRSTIIERIEADLFEKVDEPVYVRAHLRRIAQVVGEDAADVVREYNASLAPEALEPEPPKPTLATKQPRNIFEHYETETLPQRRTHSAQLLALGVIALLLLIGWARFGPGRSSADPNVVPSLSLSESATPTETASASVTPSESATPLSTDTASATPTGVDPNVVTVKVTANGACWLQIFSSTGQVLLAKTIYAGDEFTFVDPTKLRVSMGSAGAVSLTVNGVELGAQGSVGTVVTRDFGLGDPTATQ